MKILLSFTHPPLVPIHLATINCLIANIFLNIFFSVQQKKETPTGLEQLKGE